MTFIKLKETEDMDSLNPAFNNIFEPTFNDSFLPGSLPQMWEDGDLFGLDQELATTSG